MNTSSTPVERYAQEEQRHIASIILHATGAAQFRLLVQVRYVSMALFTARRKMLTCSPSCKLYRNSTRQ